MSIYVAHTRETSNALYALVHSKHKRGMLLCQTGLCLYMCHSHSHVIIPIPVSSPIATPIPWESHSHGNSHSHAYLYIEITYHVTGLYLARYLSSSRTASLPVLVQSLGPVN